MNYRYQIKANGPFYIDPKNGKCPDTFTLIKGPFKDRCKEIVQNKIQKTGFVKDLVTKKQLQIRVDLEVQKVIDKQLELGGIEATPKQVKEIRKDIQEELNWTNNALYEPPTPQENLQSLKSADTPKKIEQVRQQIVSSQTTLVPMPLSLPVVKSQPPVEIKELRYPLEFNNPPTPPNSKNVSQSSKKSIEQKLNSIGDAYDSVSSKADKIKSIFNRISSSMKRSPKQVLKTESQISKRSFKKAPPLPPVKQNTISRPRSIPPPPVVKQKTPLPPKISQQDKPFDLFSKLFSSISKNTPETPKNSVMIPSSFQPETPKNSVMIPSSFQPETPKNSVMIPSSFQPETPKNSVSSVIPFPETPKNMSSVTSINPYELYSKLYSTSKKSFVIPSPLPPPRVSTPISKRSLPPPRVSTPVPKLSLQPPRVSTPISKRSLPPPRVSTPILKRSLPPPRVSTPILKRSLPPPRVSTPILKLSLPPPRVSTPVPKLSLPPPRVSTPVPKLSLPPPQQLSVSTPSEKGLSFYESLFGSKKNLPPPPPRASAYIESPPPMYTRPKSLPLPLEPLVNSVFQNTLAENTVEYNLPLPSVFPDIKIKKVRKKKEVEKIKVVKKMKKVVKKMKKVVKKTKRISSPNILTIPLNLEIFPSIGKVRQCKTKSKK